MSENFLVRGGLETGSLVAGYRIESRLGAGGMAVVFQARDERLGRSIALKVMAPQWARDEEFRRRFVAESRAAARVDDPHIIPVYGAGAADGVLFIAMRLVAGSDLRGVLRREGPLPPARALELLSPVASALDAAHAAGLVHRDVKPGNILVDERPGRPDHVYLADFGLSKSAAAGMSLTSAGSYLGTPDYSAPEQVRGHHVDGRADQYALACVAFELLTGRAPYEREMPMAVLLAHVSQPPPSLATWRPGTPVTADRVLARALAKSPEQRYASCRDFTDTLREAFGLPHYGSGGMAPRAAVAFPHGMTATSGMAPRPDAPARAPAGPAPGPATTAGPHRKPSSTRAVAVGQGTRPGVGAGDGHPSPRRRRLVTALAGVALAAAVAIGWLLAPNPGATAAKTPAKAPARAPATTLARLSATLPAPAGSHAVESAAFRPGTATLAVGMFNGDVDLWDTTTKEITGVLHDPAGGSDGVALVAFGPGGSTLAVGDGGDVYLWDTADQAAAPTASLPAPVDASGQSVTSVAFGPGGTTLAVGYSGGDVYLWDTATQQASVTLTAPADTAGTTLVAFGPGTTLAVGYSGGDVYLWDTATSENTATLTGPPGLQGTDGVGSLAFGPGGTTMAVGYDNGDAYRWDTASKQTTATIAPPADSQASAVVAFGPGGTTMAVGYDNGDVHLWDTTAEKTTGILHRPGGGPRGTGGVSAVAFGPGATLAVGAANGDVYLWHVKG
jgi:serine/threonine-protein kinase